MTLWEFNIWHVSTYKLEIVVLNILGNSFFSLCEINIDMLGAYKRTKTVKK